MARLLIQENTSTREMDKGGIKLRELERVSYSLKETVNSSTREIERGGVDL